MKKGKEKGSNKKTLDEIGAICLDIRMDYYEDRKMTQSELADTFKELGFGIDRSRISLIETGNVEMSFNELKAYKEISGYSFEYLMGISEAKKPENIEISKVIGLSDKGIESFKFASNSVHSELLKDLFDCQEWEITQLLILISEYSKIVNYENNTLKLILENFKKNKNILTKDDYTLKNFKKYNEITINDLEAARRCYNFINDLKGRNAVKALNLLDTKKELKDFEKKVIYNMEFEEIPYKVEEKIYKKIKRTTPLNIDLDLIIDTLYCLENFERITNAAKQILLMNINDLLKNRLDSILKNNRIY